MKQIIFILFLIGAIACSTQKPESKEGDEKPLDEISTSESLESDTESPSCLKLEYDWQSEILSKNRRSIVDYFLLLPKDIIYCESFLIDNENEENRKSLITKENVKNGYLESGSFVAALFKDRTNNKNFIALQRGLSGVGSTCGGINTIMELQVDQKCWVYRDDLLPLDSDIQQAIEQYKLIKNTDEVLPYFVLPEFGTTIKLQDEGFEETICEMKWNGQRFEIKTQK